MRRSALHGLFFLSGASALVYELVWQRQLHLVFGVSTLAVSAVLATFLGGLALGGLLFGRLADRATRPLRLYAALEAGIGALALLVGPGFALLTDVYVSLSASWHPGPWAGAGLRFALSLLVLLAPATLLGATVPVMARLAWRSPGSPTASFSLLYAINTLGAVAGAALTGLVLLRQFGMQQTLHLAVALNFLVAAAALLADRFLGETRASARPEPETGAAPWLALSCAALTGLTCTGLEVVWARILGILTSNSAFGMALLLMVVLLGLGTGSLLQAAWARRPGDCWGRLALCQWALAALTLASAPFFRSSPEWFVRVCLGATPGKIFLSELALTAAALLAPALLLGLSFPLLVAGVGRPSGARLGRLYAVNTLGCVAGAFLTGLVFIPLLGIRGALGACIACPLLVGMLAWGQAAWPAAGWRQLAGGAVGVVLLFAWLALPEGRYLKSVVRAPRRLLYYREGNNGTVAVIEEANATRSISVDGQPVAGTSGTSVVDQKMLAHLPLLLHPAPRRALTVGFGSGGTSHSMTLHDIDVDCVEIEARVPGAAEHFLSENHGVLTHPRFRLILDDARSWLRSPQRYDVIVTDCTNIQYRSNGDLYTVEYFRLMKERLSADGLAAAWVPANRIHEADLKVLLRSFRAVFPHTSVWFMNNLPTDFLIVVGTPSELTIDFEQLRRRAARPAVRADLAGMGLADPVRLVHTFLTGGAALGDYLGAGPLNTDDRPVLSYSTYGSSFRDTIAGNLLGLMACRQDVSGYVKNGPSRALMMRHSVAAREALLGHVRHQTGDEAGALRHYLEGARLLPGDVALDRLVRETYREFLERH